MTTGGVSSGTLDTSVVANLLLDPSRNSDMGKFVLESSIGSVRGV